MHRMKHPFDGSLYELQSDGRIRITSEQRSGLFEGDGRWVEGDLRQADPQFCVWVSNRPRPGEQLSDWGLSGQADVKA